jgi:hypothetical protein
MAHASEADCLLETGALYPRRIGLKTPAGTLVFAGVKHGAFSLYYGDEPIYHLDLEGRWQRMYIEGTHYRKALDGSAVALDREREGGQLVLRRQPLSFMDTFELDDRVRQAAIDLIDDLQGGRLTVVPPPAGNQPLPEAELLDLLDRVTRWDGDAWLRQREMYIAIYGPPPFLPPDAHQSVVLQALFSAEGPGASPIIGPGGQAIDVKTPEEFEKHAHDVGSLLGRRLAQCRSVFLSGGDALRLPIGRLAGYFETIARIFPIATGPGPARRSELDVEAVQLRGIDVFLPDFQPPLPDRAGWERLKALHLGRVNLGISSGDLQVRSLFGPSWSDPELRQTVGALKGASIPLGLIVLVGAGGVAQADAHLSATADLLRTLPLDREDIVYLMDVADLGDPSLGGQVHPLSGPACERQLAGFKERLASLTAKVVPYSRDKQPG